MSRLCAILLAIAIVITASSTCFAAKRGGAYVRVLHASPNAPTVDVLANDKVAVSNLSYATMTPYYLLPRGTATFKLNVAGTSNTALGPIKSTFTPKMEYTIIATGILNGEPPLEIFSISEKIQMPSTCYARIRIIHLAPDAGEVDIYANDKPIVKNVSYKGYTKYMDVTPGTYSVKVNTAGTDTVVLGPTNITLNQNTMYTIVAMGKASDGTLKVKVFQDQITSKTLPCG